MAGTHQLWALDLTTGQVGVAAGTGAESIHDGPLREATFAQPSGLSALDGVLYVADSESGPDTGAHELTGIKKGIRIGSAKTSAVTAFIEDLESTTPDHSGAEGVGVDLHGNVYGAVVRRQMLERHVRK